jgi:disulfide bond formation protein DsbB
MRMMFERLLRVWPALALAASALMLAIAHGFQTFGGLAPCMLCLRQREVYWVALPVALVAVLVQRTRWRGALSPWIGAALTLVFLSGAYIAVYHAGAEWKWWPGPSTCSGVSSHGAGLADLHRLMAGAKIKPPSCEVAAWRLWGLSMAGWNALISLGLAALTGVWALRGPHAASEI